jgi:hypothetical protein
MSATSWTRPEKVHVLAKPCLHCGHLKGKHGRELNRDVHPFHPLRVRYFCVGDCGCKRHSDEDRYYVGLADAR